MHPARGELPRHGMAVLHDCVGGRTVAATQEGQVARLASAGHRALTSSSYIASVAVAAACQVNVAATCLAAAPIALRAFGSAAAFNSATAMAFGSRSTIHPLWPSVTSSRIPLTGVAMIGSPAA